MLNSDFYKRSSFIAALVVSFAAFTVFLADSHIMSISLVMILISLFLIAPYRKKSNFLGRYLLLIGIILTGWLVSVVGATILPFVATFVFVYILDPIVVWFEKRKIPRWVSSIGIVLLLVGIVSAIAVFVFPIIFDQLDNVIKKISLYAKQTTDYVESESFYRTLRNLGLPRDTVKSLIREELLPRMEGVAQSVFTGMLSILNSLSTVATQIVNAIIVPILTFYLLKDFPKLKSLIKSILEVKNKKALNDLRRIDAMLKRYIGWQILAMFIVGSVSSFVFYMFDLPYPIVIGALAGLLNPIPLLSTIISSAIGILTIILVNQGNIIQQILVVLGTVFGLHFINAYLLEPNIAGKQVGLHPVVLIISLFVFSALFGFVGLLIAVPTTAILMMFFNDWVEKLSFEGLGLTASAPEEEIVNSGNSEVAK